MTIANNTVMTNLDKYIKGGLIDDGEIIKVSDEFVKQLRTKNTIIETTSSELIRW